jgi:hypothetical protein
VTTLLDRLESQAGAAQENRFLRPCGDRFPGYLVGAAGDVWSVKRRLFHEKAKPRAVRPQRDAQGKLYVVLIGADRRKHKVGVARLVREAWPEAAE